MNLRPVPSRQQAGFTLIELLIATAVFSVILLLAMGALVQIGKSYYQGVIKGQTQEVARSVVQNISESIQFSGGSITTITANGEVNGFCVDNKRFSYIPNKKLSDDTPTPSNARLHALVVDTVNGCSSSTLAQSINVNPIQGKELISPNMRVIISPPVLVSGSTNLWQIGITVIYGDDDLISGGQCVSIRIGGQFCAVSNLNTTVEKRVK